jgi:hypothetical protein
MYCFRWMFHLWRLFAQNVFCYTCFRRIDRVKVRKCAFCSPVCVLTVLQIPKTFPSRLILWDLQRLVETFRFLVRIRHSNRRCGKHICVVIQEVRHRVFVTEAENVLNCSCGYQHETYGVRSVHFLPYV